MASLTEAQRAFIHETKYTGVLTTLRPDGSPHTTVVWLDVEGDDVIFNTAQGRAKERHTRNDPRVSMIVVDPSNPFKWVSITGRVTLETEGGRAMIDRLSQKYEGKNYPDEWMQPGEVRVTGRISVEKVDSAGFDS